MTAFKTAIAQCLIIIKQLPWLHSLQNFYSAFHNTNFQAAYLYKAAYLNNAQWANQNSIPRLWGRNQDPTQTNADKHACKHATQIRHRMRVIVYIVICLYREVRVHPEVMWCMQASELWWRTSVNAWRLMVAEWMMKAWCSMIYKVCLLGLTSVLMPYCFSTFSFSCLNTPPNARETDEEHPSPSRRGYELLQPGSGSEWDAHRQKQSN